MGRRSAGPYDHQDGEVVTLNMLIPAGAEIHKGDQITTWDLLTNEETTWLITDDPDEDGRFDAQPLETK